MSALVMSKPTFTKRRPVIHEGRARVAVEMFLEQIFARTEEQIFARTEEHLCNVGALLKTAWEHSCAFSSGEVPDQS
jgi:hypothetical protein